jgi:hypothetical protein
MATLSHRPWDTHLNGEPGEALVTEGSNDQTDKWVEREEAHARQVISTAKLVVTFSAAIAATFVAAVMQAPNTIWWDTVAAGLMAVALGITVRVVLLPSRPEEGRLDKDTFKDPSKRVIAADKAVQLADRTHHLTKIQIWFSALSSLVAGLGLLATDWHWI